MSTTTHYSLGLGERDRVDHAFGGGLPRGSITLIEGPDGAGKSVLTQRMAYGMATEGTHVSVVSPELSAREYIDQMHSLSYDVVQHLLEDRLAYFHVDVDTHTRSAGGMAGTRPLVSKFTEPSVIWHGDVVIVDGFGALLRNDPEFDAVAETADEDHFVQSVVRFLDRMTAADRAVVLTVNPALLADRAVQPLRDAADVYLSIERSTVGQDIRRKALVNRFVGMANQVDDTIGFDVQHGRGIVIVSRTVA
ncbi:ATPase domain-containing protein [Natronomonas marina]|jgi:flagellar protein FlaH|uniref:ATPase domain-containing protein n=1 Tax=Natronomonas marina TaxID=2961939 RepID=UPI0020C941DE|nr:ATPase domain-containing protein [Natronomonas marina]